MREILFRGKRKDGGIWLCGDLRQWSETRKGILDYSLRGTSEVDPETVGQFTGLTDKHGTKIFEGDILKYQINIKTAIVGKIIFVCGAFAFESEELDELEWVTFADDEILMSQHCIEIIGNIHDNNLGDFNGN